MNSRFLLYFLLCNFADLFGLISAIRRFAGSYCGGWEDAANASLRFNVLSYSENYLICAGVCICLYRDRHLGVNVCNVRDFVTPYPQAL